MCLDFCVWPLRPTIQSDHLVLHLLFRPNSLICKKLDASKSYFAKKRNLPPMQQHSDSEACPQSDHVVASLRVPLLSVLCLITLFWPGLQHSGTIIQQLMTRH